MTGTITLIGSGETSRTGGMIFEAIARQQAEPLCISILETPAGFEANASRVAGRIAGFLKTRLQNYHPIISQIAARKKGTLLSPDLPEVVYPLYNSNLIFFGPGSPTYTVRQLQDSLTWYVLQARHRLGASLVLASAATIAFGALALPVYEIYKVGDDLHWKPGLDFFGPYGLSLVIVPHWNNREGGEELDTSRCFLGQERFNEMQNLLPPEVTVLGVDEHTAITINFQTQTCRVTGRGSVHLFHGSNQQECPAKCEIPIHMLGDYHPLPTPETGLPPAIWQQALNALSQPAVPMTETIPLEIPPEVHRLVNLREEARRLHDWALSDQLRQQILSLGWQISDSPAGPQLQPPNSTLSK
jgi:hypothetical protein